jgi:hypothetical protein
MRQTRLFAIALALAAASATAALAMNRPQPDQKQPSRPTLQRTQSDPSLPSHARALEPLFGTEMTFSSQQLIADYKTKGDSVSIPKKRAWKDKLDEICGGGKKLSGFTCRSSDGTDAFTGETWPQATFPDFDDWYYQVTTDHDVIELKTKPMTLATAIKLEDLINKTIFLFAKNTPTLKLNPQPAKGAGHIHIDVATGFDGDPILLLNFMTDIHNLGFWPMYDVNEELQEATPLALQPETGGRAAYAALVDQVSKGFPPEAGSDGQQRSRWLIEQIRTSVYTSTRNRMVNATGKDKPSIRKYQTLCLEKISSTSLGTVEIRAMRPQPNAKLLVATLKLLHRRIVHGTKRGVVVPFAPPALTVDRSDRFDEASRKEIARRFVAYVKGANPEDGKDPLSALDFIDLAPAQLKEAVRAAAQPQPVQQTAPQKPLVRSNSLPDLRGKTGTTPPPNSGKDKAASGASQAY